MFSKAELILLTICGLPQARDVTDREFNNIKAKVKVKTSYSSSADTANLKLYVIKVDGEYKIVSAELD